MFFAAALLACEPIYVIAANVFLSTSLFEKVVDGEPEVVDIHYARAWSLIPSRIHAEKLTIRGTDSNVEWILKLDEVDFTVGLVELAKQRFHVTRARGSGITFRLRRRVDAPLDTEERIALVPPIDGLPRTSIKPDVPPYAGTWSDADWKLWTIHLEDVVAEHVHEIWVDEGRFTGDARIAGGFYLKPIRAVEIGPIDLRVAEGGAVAFAAKPVLDALAGSASLTIERFDPREIPVDALLAHVSSAADLRGAIVDAADLPVAMPKGVRLAGAIELRRFAPRVDHGAVADDSHVDLRAPSLVATVRGKTLRGALAVRGDVAGRRLGFHAEADEVDVAGVASIARLDLDGDSTELALARPLGDLHLVVDVPRAEARDARRLDAHVLAGSARASAHVEAWMKEERAAGRLSVGVTGLELRAGEVRVRGDARADASVGSLLWADERASDVHVDLRVSAGTLADASTPEPLLRASGLRVDAGCASLVLGHRLRCAAGTLDVRAERIDLRHGDVDVAGDVTAHALVDAPDLRRGLVVLERARVDARGVGSVNGETHAKGDVAGHLEIPRWDLARHTLDLARSRLTMTNVSGGFVRGERVDFTAARVALSGAARDVDLEHATPRGVDATLDVSGAALDDARALNRVLPRGDQLAIESGGARGAVELALSGGVGTGHVVVELTRAGVKLHTTHVSGDFLVEGRLARIDPANGRSDVAGSRVAMRNVRVTGASEATSSWHGDVVLQEGTLRLLPSPELEADATLAASDARPLLAVVAPHLPDFIVGLTAMPRLDASTHLRVGPDLVVFTDALAGGGNLSLRGLYALREGETRGAFVVEKGILSAGLRLATDGVHVHFFGLKTWLREQASDVLRFACADRGRLQPADVPVECAVVRR